MADLHDDNFAAVVVDHDAGAACFVVHRGARVAVNLGPPVRIALNGAFTVAFTTSPDVVIDGSDVVLPADSAAILLSRRFR